MDFAEAKQHKERGMSVKDVLENALKESKDTHSVLVVRLMNNDDVPTSFSWESSLEGLGMLEIARKNIVDYMEK